MTTPDFIFDSIDIPAVASAVGAPVRLQSIRGRGTLAPTVTTAKTPGRPGSRLVETQLPSREITVGIAVWADEESSLRDRERALSGLLIRDRECPLTFSDQPDRHYQAILSDVSLDTEERTWQIGTLTFTCPDPYLYAPADVTATPTSGELDCDTNHVIDGVFALHAATSATGFTLTVNGAALVYEGSIPSSADITVDCIAREVRVNGTLKVVEVDGDWPQLRAHNTITCDLPVQVTYRPRWV